MLLSWTKLKLQLCSSFFLFTSFTDYHMTPVTPFMSELNQNLLYLCLPGVNSKSARVLLMLVIPGHLVFLYAISLLQGEEAPISIAFTICYLCAALLQVHCYNSISTAVQTLSNKEEQSNKTKSFKTKYNKCSQSVVELEDPVSYVSEQHCLMKED